MPIRPLQGQCLVEMLPADKFSAGGLEIPLASRDKLLKGIVRIMGHWPRSKNGIHHLPEFQVGQTVIVGKYTGIQMKDFGDKFKMVRIRDVMAVIL